MSKQVLLCVEADSKSRSDYVYVESVIKHFYENDRKIIYRGIFLGSKTKYNDKGKIKEIESRIKAFSGTTYVIYFIDVDDYDTSRDTQKLFDIIKNYCSEKNYDFVFFSRDVEDVFWGKTVNDCEKVKMAQMFNRKKMISKVAGEKLCVSEKYKHSSNILTILDKYWTRKK